MIYRCISVWELLFVIIFTDFIIPDYSRNENMVSSRGSAGMHIRPPVGIRDTWYRENRTISSKIGQFPPESKLPDDACDGKIVSYLLANRLVELFCTQSLKFENHNNDNDS